MVKERRFLNVVDLVFDTKFTKYYRFSLGYCKAVANKLHRCKMFRIWSKNYHNLLTFSSQEAPEEFRKLQVPLFRSPDSNF